MFGGTVQFCLGLWVYRPAVFLLDAVVGEGFLKRVASAFSRANRAVNTSPLSVSVDAGGPKVSMRRRSSAATAGPENAARAVIDSR